MVALKRKRVVRRRMRGRGVGDVLGKVNQVAKETKILSNVLGKVLGDDSFLAKSASTLGYGRKRVARRAAPRRRMRGRGIADVLAGIGSGIGRAGSGFLGGLFGGAKRRRTAPKRRMRGGFSTAVYRTRMPMIGSGANILTY